MKRVIVKYKDLSRWDVKSFTSNFIFWGIKLVPFWNILKDAKIEFEKIEKDKEYKILWVRSYWKWVFESKIVKWANLLTTSTTHNQKIKKNMLFWCKVDTKNWAFWITKEEHIWYYASKNMIQVEINLDLVLPEYLQLLFSLKFFQNYLDSFVVWLTNRKYISFTDLVNIPFPLPNKDIQKQIVEDFENNKIKAQNLKNEALEKEKNIDDFLMSELGIEKQEQKRKKWPFIVRYKDLERWWVEFNAYDWTLDNLFYSNKFGLDKIWNVAKINEVIEFEKEDQEKQISFIPMEYVSDKDWIIEKVESKKFKTVYTWYTKFIEWDIIWAKITPCMQNWKSAIAKNMENWIWVWSTEFHVIRPNNKIYDKYLWLILRSQYLLDNAKRYFTGSAWQQRVPDTFLKDLKIPLPTIWDEKTPWTQKYIVSKIDEIKKEIDKLNIEAERLEKEADENLEKTILWV